MSRRVRLRLARRLRRSEWPRLARQGREPVVLVYGLSYREMRRVRRMVPHTATGDYLATTGRELDRLLTVLMTRRYRTPIYVRLEWR